MEETFQFTVDNRPVRVTTDGERMLLWVLRTDLGLTGTKYGCGENQCGACTVLVNKEPVRSCQYPVKDVARKEVLTIEGLEQNGELHPLQKAFIKHGAFQCGFCTSGMILTAYSLLLKNPKASIREITEGMEWNLCRCGTYGRIINAIAEASIEMRGGKLT